MIFIEKKGITMTALLKDTTLAMIVRDEMMNPAGGIERFLDAHLPLVEKAVVADTGSVDGTHEYLIRRAEKEKNLQVFQKPWSGSFSDARNASLEPVQTKYILILDADELLTEEEAQKMASDFREKMVGLNPKIMNIHPSGTIDYESNCLQPRLFKKRKDILFTKDVGEVLKGGKYFQLLSWDCFESDATIRHFLPQKKAIRKKRLNWYDEKEFKSQQPLHHAQREGWKELNPYREFYS